MFWIEAERNQKKTKRKSEHRRFKTLFCEKWWTEWWWRAGRWDQEKALQWACRTSDSPIRWIMYVAIYIVQLNVWNNLVQLNVWNLKVKEIIRLQFNRTVRNKPHHQVSCFKDVLSFNLIIFEATNVLCWRDYISIVKCLYSTSNH